MPRAHPGESGWTCHGGLAAPGPLVDNIEAQRQLIIDAVDALLQGSKPMLGVVFWIAPCWALKAFWACAALARLSSQGFLLSLQALFVQPQTGGRHHARTQRTCARSALR
jgi:hypothetical protein